MNEMVRIKPEDMVAVALRPIKAGETVSYGGGTVTLKEDIPMGHKAALRDIARGEAVIKYGFPIGEATADIPEGGHVHTHNLHTLLSGEKEYTWHPAGVKREHRKAATFMGYPRKNGRPGFPKRNRRTEAGGAGRSAPCAGPCVPRNAHSGGLFPSLRPFSSLRSSASCCTS